MALEILLKAGGVQEHRRLPKLGHAFPALFLDQADSLRRWVRDEFGARGLARPGLETGAPLETQLERLQFNYARARYLYEPSIENSGEEQREREQSFLDGTLPPEDWDIIYHPELVELMTEAMLRQLRAWVPEWFGEGAEGE